MWETLESRRMMSVSTITTTQEPPPPTTSTSEIHPLTEVSNQFNALSTLLDSAIRSLSNTVQQAARNA